VPESAFIIRVPEAEPYVARLRAQFDPSAVLGVPAHITVLYPFMSPERISEKVVARARSLAAETAPFSFRLVAIKRFPGVVYLAPEPAASLVSLLQAVSRAFPEYPPYEGRHPSTIPHLTVARTDESQHAAIEAELRSCLPLPRGIVATCEQLVLIENSSGRWSQMHSFSFRQTPPDG
jgi:2'-5' RNA ligase